MRGGRSLVACFLTNMLYCIRCARWITLKVGSPRQMLGYHLNTRALVCPWRHLNSWPELREKRCLFIGIIRTWNLNLITGTDWNLRERNDELTTIYSQQNQILVSERKEAYFWETSICQGDLVPLPILTITRRWVSATGSVRDFTLCASWQGSLAQCQGCWRKTQASRPREDSTAPSTAGSMSSMPTSVPLDPQVPHGWCSTSRVCVPVDQFHA